MKVLFVTLIFISSIATADTVAVFNDSTGEYSFFYVEANDGNTTIYDDQTGSYTEDTTNGSKTSNYYNHDTGSQYETQRVSVDTATGYDDDSGMRQSSIRQPD